MTDKLPFILDNEQYVTNQKCFIITGDYLEFLTCFFNSKLFHVCFKRNFPHIGKAWELNKEVIIKIPIIFISKEINEIFKNILNKLQDKYDTALENLMNLEILRLYNNLDEDELNFILNTSI